MSRLPKTFERLNREKRAAFITFITGGDPDFETSLKILKGLPAAGADIIELGMPFTDPSADGPSIDKAAQRALASGGSLKNTLKMVAEFRHDDQETPIVLMGYFNPVYTYGIESFSTDAAEAGVDGLIIVDLPPEEDEELRGPANTAGLDVVRLITPTSDDERIQTIVDGASGFVYYVAVAGITGAQSSTAQIAGDAVQRIKKHTDLPVAIGFGIRTQEQAREMAKVCDAAVVGSAIVETIAADLDKNGKASVETASKTLEFVKSLAAGVRSA
ncbi:tryptophan synthase subunit alpha [Temperatibacter marinus]|uniref:Tryptophan synthase alpha chain n=1 Tax=Temperatibacter marinus TaxID=1456591 RepID=A0AA52HAG5_9PROT|nr:tryptophan synthase subunit alpha [Temperatibacter marinus]WND03939.1 tryptophan synthase subunit alpha [Temperatibacter marinus]